MKRKKKLAVFDIDGTIFRSSLLIELVEELIGEGLFPAKTRAIYVDARRKWLERSGGYEMYIEAVVTAFQKHIKGISYLDLNRVAKKVMKIHRYRVYRYTRDLAMSLKRKNYYLLAISNSPKIIADEFCRTFKFDKVYGRLYDKNEAGVFTGRMEGKIRGWKDTVLERALSGENMSIKGSLGVGDTESDIPFLKKVDRPICFNPNKKLYRYAKSKKWPIVVERKDVIYEIN